MVILNLGVYFTLENGYKSFTEIDEITEEGLNFGFLDIYEVIDINWLCEENGFDRENTFVKEWEIKPLDKEDTIELDI